MTTLQYISYILCAIGTMVAAQTNIAFKRPVSANGSRYDSIESAVDGNRMTRASVVSGWLKVELDGPCNITAIYLLEARITHPGRPARDPFTTHVLLLEKRNDVPDPTKHYSCFNMSSTSSKDYPKQIVCSSSKKHRAVALWCSNGWRMSTEQIRITGVIESIDPTTTVMTTTVMTRTEPTTSIPTNPVHTDPITNRSRKFHTTDDYHPFISIDNYKDNNNSPNIAMSTTVLLGCQVLVLIIYHIMQ